MITTYATLQTEVLGFVGHTGDTDLTAALPTLIQLAEGELKDDIRARKMTCSGTFTIRQDGETLPEYYGEMDSWYHDGPTYYGPIEICTLEQLADFKARIGDTGVPQYAALTLDGERVFFAPEPDATYITRMAFKMTITNLSGTNTTNWLLEDHPQVYLYAVARQVGKWLKDREMSAEYEQELEKLLDKMYISGSRKQFSGRLKGRPRRPIGG